MKITTVIPIDEGRDVEDGFKHFTDPVAAEQHFRTLILKGHPDTSAKDIEIATDNGIFKSPNYYTSITIIAREV